MSRPAFQEDAFQNDAFQVAGIEVLVAPPIWQDVGFDPGVRLDAMAEELADLERFISEVESAGDEYVDPFESEIDADFYLTGTRRRGRR